MTTYLWIGLGGFLGANARYLVQTWAAKRWGINFPLGTMMANVTGAFLLTLFALLLAERFNVRPEIRIFVATGFLGSYTTFSSLGYETWLLFDSRGWGWAALNLFGNLLLGGFVIMVAVLIAKGLASS